MTDDTSQPAGDGTPSGSGPAEGRSPQAHEWLSQLQQMIDRVAAEASPVARDVAAKAAELAAVAGEKAGPFAKRAAEVTEGVGSRVATRSRRLADDLRHHGGEDAAAPEWPSAEPGAAGAATGEPAATGQPSEAEGPVGPSEPSAG